MKTQDGRRLMLDAIAECRTVAQLHGHAIPEPVVAAMQARLLDEASTWAASMMRDIAQGAPRIEADVIVGDLIKRAAGYGHELPLSRAAYCHLQVYQGQRAAHQTAG
jgi:2-dehydropantoate 2-reductase